MHYSQTIGYKNNPSDYSPLRSAWPTFIIDGAEMVPVVAGPELGEVPPQKMILH